VRLEYDIASLLQDLEAFKSLEQQISELEASYNESRNAALKVRDLSGFQRQVQQLQEQIQQSETDLQERRQDAASLSGSEAQLEEVNAELLQLNDPRSHSKVQQAIIMQEGNYLRQQRTEQQKNLEIQQKLQILQEQLAAYDTLDVDIAMQDSIRRQCQPGYQSYLKNVEIALTLSAREHTCQRQLSATEQARQTLQEAEQAYYTAQANFDESELAIVKSALDQLCKDQIDLAAKMELHQRVMHELEKKIQETEAKLIELEAAQKVYQELNDLHTMTEYFRKLIKEAAPYVLKAMLQNISAEANRIFGEIMGDRSALLSWQNDYEVVLRRQGINRTFAQLSGGEQMSAALAVRLALLKKLSTLNIAFFDEPTQNMDELRRVNLAEQIRRVRGFDQLIVISHDDTFEQGLDSLIHLQKDDGETRLAHGDIVSRETTEELTLWNKSSVSIVQ
jgi:exonuclease SbcC